MHHLHHQKYGHPDADTYRACCHGPQVGCPTIVWALAAREPPTIVAAMIAATMRITTKRFTVRYFLLAPARAS